MHNRCFGVKGRLRQRDELNCETFPSQETDTRECQETDKRKVIKLNGESLVVVKFWKACIEVQKKRRMENIKELAQMSFIKIH